MEDYVKIGKILNGVAASVCENLMCNRAFSSFGKMTTSKLLSYGCDNIIDIEILILI